MNDMLKKIKVLRKDVKRKVGERLNKLFVAIKRILVEVINELESFYT